MIKKISENNYAVSVSLGFNPLTKKYDYIRKQGIKSRKEAEAIETDALNKKRGKQFLINNKYTLNDIATRYFTNYSHGNKQSYTKLQKGFLKNHINPFFSDTNIKDLRLNDIQLFQQTMIKKENKQKKRPLDNKTINKVFIFLNQLFDVAVKENIIPFSPCEHLQKLKEEKKEMNFWTLSEYKEFLSRINENEPHIKIFFQTDYFTGLRGGEMVSLLWSKHFNENTKELIVQKTSSIENKQVITTSVKTKASHRRVTLNQKLFEALIEWKQTQKNLLESLGVDYNEEEIYIFQYSERSPRRDYFYRKIKEICQRGTQPMKNIRLHDFRHSHVAYIIDKDEEPVIIKERLGHASITTTIDTYGHLYPNKQQETSDKFDNDF